MNPAHYDYEVLADLAEGLLEDDEAASVNAHLDTCAECRDLSADLADVSRILAEAPVPSMPAELAERIDTAIAAESMHSATVVSMEQRRGRRHWRILSAAAAAVVVVGGGAMVGNMALDGVSGDHGQASTPAQDSSNRNDAEHGVAPNAAPAGAFTVARTGTGYREGTLGAQVGRLLADGQRLKGASSAPSAQLKGCVKGVTHGLTPALVDDAEYEGAPAIIIAAHGVQTGKWNIWVVGPDCSEQNQRVLKKLENA
ncbi:Transmembrane transcriptional regulator (anti-sigma factor RsiW) [Actinomadura meyerae]|uniref:Transmembrane transcriptional regulator (Anti-sigma factor RsiW) n=1 Tax=Actinomadura meyerae TaxID=240840 RepID=A0A239KUX0_9ACTN|nr:zf-HC2 domain-containing protein [Actinomadura meyerae]SNT21458.1 Transmembrane transcriptional regulator (anti-sigma factor RsiW) [Actinomadura meyerae]